MTIALRHPPFLPSLLLIAAILSFCPPLDAAPAQEAPIRITPPAASPPPAGDDAATVQAVEDCAAAIAMEEKKNGIPAGLLASISMVESGRIDPRTGKRTAWPWTINAQGEGKYFATKAEAMAVVVELLKGDVGRIDVGCMQVNLYHHPKAFRSLEEAFDPRRNVEYAARFLKSLAQSKGSWTSGVAAYHAGENGLHGGPYLSKVLAEWRGDNKSASALLKESWDEQPQPLELAYRDFDKGDMAGALKRYGDILKLDPDNRIALLGSAMAMERLGRIDEALAAYRRVLIADPYNRAAFDSMLDRIESSPPQERLEKLTELHRLAPHFYEAPARIAEMHIARNGLEAAAGFLAAAADLAPEEPRLRLNQALVEDRLGRRSRAIAAYEQFLKNYERQMVSLTVPLESVIRRLNYLKTTPE